MISTRLKELLDTNKVFHSVVSHDPAFTAQELAHEMHVPGHEFVKAVIVKVDGHFAVAAVPAHRLVDLKALARVAKVKKCSLADESEMRQLFPDCEVGAMPPLGNLYRLATFVDEEVTDNESVIINAGTHGEAVRLRFTDLKRLAAPQIGSFAVAPPAEIAAHMAKPQRKLPKAKKKTAKAKPKKKAKPRKKAKAKKKKITKKRPTKRKAKRKVSRKKK
jgi:Ala-tRNA(Pro) deacylase